MLRWFINLRTSTKLVGYYGMFVVLICAVVWQGLASSRATKELQEAELTAGARVTTVLKDISIERLRIIRTMMLATIETDPTVMARLMRTVEESEVTLKKLVAEAEGAISDPVAHAAIVEIGTSIPAWMALGREAVALSPQGDAKGEPSKMLERLREQMRRGGAMDVKLTTVDDRVKARATENAAARQVQDDRTFRISLGVVALMFVVAGLCTRLLVTSIARPLRTVIEVLARVAAGDLTARTDLDRTDEIGEMATALNTTVDAMRLTLVNVSEVSREVSSASLELAANAEAISSGAQEQAASLEETAASLEEISSTVKQNTDNAQEASQLANSARDSAERGGQVVSAAVSAMEEITKSSKKIADIITTIDEIAFQTNLLALNAAVEAARAGEQGRGFGVVAAEVRTLAQRTGAAAKEIRGLIADSSSKVEVGTHQVNESGRTLHEIVTSVKRVTDMVAEIAAASREQNTGLDQVNMAVTQVDQVTQSNAAQTEELSATATALSDRSTRLQELVDAFDLGAAPSPPARHAAPVERSAQPSARREASARARPNTKLAKVIPLSSRRPPPLPASSKAAGYEEF